MKRLKLTLVVLLIALCLVIAICSIAKNGENEIDLSELENVVFSNDRFTLTYTEGYYSLYDGKVAVVNNAYFEAVESGNIYRSYDYAVHNVYSASTYDFRSSVSEITIALSDNGKPDMEQKFYFFDEANYLLFKTILYGGVKTNYVAPLVLNKGDFYLNDIPYNSFIDVPFDNDQWVSYEAHSLAKSGAGHEVGAFVNWKDKSGLVIGSLEHNEWKSLVLYDGNIEGIGQLKVYSGANTSLTRDQSPHGTICRQEVASSTFTMGFYEDWQKGLNEYARLNTTFTPKRDRVISYNPIGWNSWGSVQTSLNYELATGISDYVKDNFQNTWQDDNNAVYINLDSYWDNMSESQLIDFVKYCEENGQKAGIYYSPFVTWFNETDINLYTIAGTDILYKDVILKKADGTPYGNDIDGCFPLDVTHPAVVNHYKSQLERLVGYGFSYIKLDFLVHGALEGIHYSDEIQTGIQAYNYAMQEVTESVGDDVFINLSMAPIFPYNYANGRRLACDTYYGINETEYVLNALTYGFWQSELYDYIDADHIVLWGKDGKATENEARSRLLSGIITGGSFLTGDNFVSPSKKPSVAKARFEELLTNKQLIDVLKLQKPFEAVVEKNGVYSAEKYILYDESGIYVAFFNFDRRLSKNFTLEIGKGTTAINLMDGSQVNFSEGSVKVNVAPCDALLIKIN